MHIEPIPGLPHLEITQSFGRSKKMILRTILDYIKDDFEFKDREESEDEDTGHMLLVKEGYQH